MADGPTADEIRFLRGEEIRELLTFEAAVDAVREAYRDRGEGADTAPRTALRNTDNGGKLQSYVAVLPESGVMGGYVYSSGFAGRSATFLLPLFDADTGAPLAVLDGRSLNPYKTGAVGAVAVDALAEPDASSLVVFGSGRQARAQVRAIAEVRDLREVRVHSPTVAHREQFAEEVGDRLDAAVTAVAADDVAVGTADVVVTATKATEPVFDGEALTPGTHVNAIGQYDPYRRELDDATIARATYVPDLRDRVHQDAGAFLHARRHGAVTDAHVYAELGAVVAGVVPGREADEITVFDSGGTALETVGVAGLVYERARAQGVGTTVEF